MPIVLTCVTHMVPVMDSHIVRPLHGTDKECAVVKATGIFRPEVI